MGRGLPPPCHQAPLGGAVAELIDALDGRLAECLGAHQGGPAVGLRAWPGLTLSGQYGKVPSKLFAEKKALKQMPPPKKPDGWENYRPPLSYVPFMCLY